MLLAASHILKEDVFSAPRPNGSLREQKQHLKALASAITSLEWTQVDDEAIQVACDAMNGVDTDFSYCVCVEGEINILQHASYCHIYLHLYTFVALVATIALCNTTCKFSYTFNRFIFVNFAVLILIYFRLMPLSGAWISVLNTDIKGTC